MDYYSGSSVGNEPLTMEPWYSERLPLAGGIIVSIIISLPIVVVAFVIMFAWSFLMKKRNDSSRIV